MKKEEANPNELLNPTEKKAPQKSEAALGLRALGGPKKTEVDPLAGPKPEGGEFDDCLKQIDEMIKHQTIMYNKKEQKISLYEGEGEEGKSEVVIHEKELYKYIYEINQESFIYFQHFDFAYTLYCLKKGEAVINTYKISENAKSIVDEQILIFNNIAYVYSKMGLNTEAFNYCKKILDLLKDTKQKKIYLMK